MTEASETNFSLESLKGFSGNIVQALLGFIGIVLFARILPPLAFGGFYFLLSLIKIADRPLSGIAVAGQKRFSESGSPKDEIMGVIFLSSMAIFVIISAIALLFSDYLIAKSHIDTAPYMIIAIIGSIALFFPFQRLVSAQGKAGRTIWLDALRSVFTLPLQIGFVLLGLGAAGMGWGLAAATLLTVPFTMYSIGTTPSLPTVDTITSIWKFAKHSIPRSAVGKVYDRLDILLLGFIAGTGLVAQYEVALKLTLPAIFLTGAITTGLMPRISNSLTKDIPIHEDIRNSLAYASIFAIPIFFGSLAMSETLIVTAYSEKYAGAGAFLIGLAMYRVFSSQSQVYGSILSGVDRPDLDLKISAAILLFNVIVGIILILAIGGIGVVIATIVAEFLRMAARRRYVVAIVDDVKTVPRELTHQFIAGAVMFLGVEFLSRSVTMDVWYTVGAVVMFGMVLYGTVLTAISPGFRVTLKSVYNDVVGA